MLATVSLFLREKKREGKRSDGETVKEVLDMNNFYIAFAVYLNLIFIAAKLWEQINWSWVWVMMPLAVLTVIGFFATLGKSAVRKKSKSNLIKNIRSIKDLIESSKFSSKERTGSRH